MYDPNKEIGSVSDPLRISGLTQVEHFNQQPTRDREYAEGGITDQINGLIRATGRLEGNMGDFFNRLKPLLRDSEPVEVDMKPPTTNPNSSGMTFELAALWQRLDAMSDALVVYSGRIDL